nr:MAG TPA: YopX protein [Bacteriophage sp.]
MEDRYLYKAKTTPKEKGEFNNVWVTGNLIVSNGKYYIHPVGNVVNVKNETGRIIVMHEVIPDTICQCTGLKDRNSKLIWENDICDRKEEYPEIVKYNNGDWILDYSYSKGKESGYCCCNLGFYALERKYVEVIGNKFDNPELLESEK